MRGLCHCIATLHPNQAGDWHPPMRSWSMPARPGLLSPPSDGILFGLQTASSRATSRAGSRRASRSASFADLQQQQQQQEQQQQHWDMHLAAQAPLAGGAEAELAGGGVAALTATAAGQPAVQEPVREEQAGYPAGGTGQTAMELGLGSAGWEYH